MPNRSIVTGRELYRLYALYVKSNVDADATYQWMGLARVHCEPGKVGEFCANWDRVMNLLNRSPPPDFILQNFLAQVRDDRSMTHIMYQYKRVREWATPSGQAAEDAYAWLRKEVRTELETDRLRIMHDGRSDIFGKRRAESKPVAAVTPRQEIQEPKQFLQPISEPQSTAKGKREEQRQPRLQG